MISTHLGNKFLFPLSSALSSTLLVKTFTELAIISYKVSYCMTQIIKVSCVCQFHHSRTNLLRCIRNFTGHLKLINHFHYHTLGLFQALRSVTLLHSTVLHICILCTKYIQWAMCILYHTDWLFVAMTY